MRSRPSASQTLARRIAGGVMRTLGRFRVATCGVAAVEFALILPFIMMMFLGTSEIGEALRVARRIERISFTVAT
ncbi:TadE/TadG family type IV pilus assembly protein [Methylobrevis pamukkalensis]|nr:TadE/TadG family type IV pilus assembly protein [Methylobrevis pamukkalensis]